MTLALADIAKNDYPTHFLAMSAKEIFALLIQTPWLRAQCKWNLALCQSKRLFNHLLWF